MSDESQPPPSSLRLRPRLSVGENEASSDAGANASRADPSASSGGVGDGGLAPEKMKIRLRPRLNAGSAVDTPRSAHSPVQPTDEWLSPATIPPSVPPVPSATVPAADAVASVSPIRLKPRSAVETEIPSTPSNAAHRAPPLASPASSGLPATSAALPPATPNAIVPPPSAKEPAGLEVSPARKAVPSEGGKLKFRSGEALIGDPGLLVGALSERPAPDKASSVSPFPPASGPAIKRTPPPFPVLDTAPKGPPVPRIPYLAARELPSGRSRRKKGTPFLTILFGLAVAGGGAYLGWSHYNKAPPFVSPITVVPSLVTSSETLNALASVPAQAIQKGQEVIASRQEKAGSAVAAIVSEQEDLGKQSPRSSAPVPVPPPMAGTTATKSVAPGLSASMPIAAAADASAAFREFVANAKISGVADTRALINGRLVRTGEVVDPTLGIRFHAVDRGTKQVIFRDSSGAQVGRRF